MTHEKPSAQNLFSRFITGRFVNHPIIHALRDQFGNNGVGVAVQILYTIRSQGVPLECTPVIIDMIATEALVTTDIVKAVINRLIDYGVFDTYEASIGKLTSADICNALSKMNTDLPISYIDIPDPRCKIHRSIVLPPRHERSPK